MWPRSAGKLQGGIAAPQSQVVGDGSFDQLVARRLKRLAADLSNLTVGAVRFIFSGETLLAAKTLVWPSAHAPTYRHPESHERCSYCGAVAHDGSDGVLMPGRIALRYSVTRLFGSYT